VKYRDRHFPYSSQCLVVGRCQQEALTPKMPTSTIKINKPNVRKVIVSSDVATCHYFIHFGGMDGRNILLLKISISTQTTVSHKSLSLSHHLRHTVLLDSIGSERFSFSSEGGRHFPFFVLVASCGQL